VKQFKKFILVAISFLLLPQAGFAADGKKLILDEVKVVGSKENVKDIAASAAFIDTKDIRTQSYDNIDRLLRKVPGVYTRAETGDGLFPNISLRGVDPGRSLKVTIMEDGILTAPGPYSAPGAYYGPTAGRMSGIEVLKGSSQVRYGPHTTGGVINYLSTQMPDSEQYYSKTLFGTYGEMRNHLYFGNTLEVDGGKFGYLIENYARRNTGFRTIEGTPDFRNGENTGFERIEPMLKLSYEPNSKRYQRFELKLGYTEMDANKSYMGTNDDDFNADPYRRYAASRYDNINTEHFRTYLRHFIEINEKTNLVTTAYGNHFFRNWAKLNKCKSPSLALSKCMNNTASDGLSVLEGKAEGSWTFKNNNRNYYLYGVQTSLTHNLVSGNTNHEINFGLRYHYDQIRRYQMQETYTQGSTGTITARSDGEWGGAGNRRQSTTAIALNMDDKITHGRWTVKPGFRVERLDLHYEDLDSSPADREDNMTVWAAGSTFDYKLSDTTNVFYGINRGYSVPSPSGATKTGADKIEEETSIGHELGMRFNRSKETGFNMELIGFWTDLDDMVVADSTGGSGADEGETRNIGEVRTRGIELQLGYDPSVKGSWGFQNPYYFTATYTDAEFMSDVGSTDEGAYENIFTGATKGKEVPNIPQIQFALGTAFIFNKLSVNIDGQYIDDTFSTGDNATDLTDLDGVADSRYGKTDSYFLLDVSMAYQATPKVNLFTNFRNLTDEVYMTSRLPHGPRAGAPLQIFGGMEITF
tara:strand:- start:1216 stop:3477 length:2262 start_codon:yes stop_codon:yes gene_type:complete